jgi:hypothetical protein
MKKSTLKIKNIFLFVFVVFVFGVICGIFFYLKQDSTMKDLIVNTPFGDNIFSLSNIFYHLFFLLIYLFLSFLFLGSIYLLGLFFFEGLSIGFVISIFFNIYKYKFLYYFIGYFLLTKLIYLIILFVIMLKSIIFTKDYFNYLKSKNSLFLKDLKYIIILIFISLLNDLITYFVFNRILNFLY